MLVADDARFIGCLLVTHLSVKAELQRRPELAGVPLVITTAGPARQRVLDAAPEAGGVSAGQTMAEALSRCPGAVTVPVDAEYLSQVNDGLLASLCDAASVVEAAGPGAFHLDLTGLAGIYSGREGLAGALLSVAPAALRPRLGLAAGKFPAHCAAARADAGGWQEVPADAARWLAPLPVSWLPLDRAVVERLRSFGIRALGDVARLTVSALTEFLGPDGIRAWRLAQGIDTNPVVAMPLPERVSERLEFPFPADTVPAIAAGINALAERLWRAASRRGRLVGEAQLRGELRSGGHWQYDRVLKQPAGSADALARALRAGLGARDGVGASRWPDAPLLDLTLTVGKLTAEAGRQARLGQPERVARVGDVAGVARLAALAPQSVLPERRWALGASLRPLNRPTRASVELAGKVPRRVRTGDDHWQPVAQVVDRWEVDTEWWTPEPVRRSYWQLALHDGGLLTVFRDGHTDEWFRQGV